MTGTTFKTLCFRVHGRVQGVWYRGWTVEQARSLGLSGWVRNRADGTVEALVHGPEDAVAELLRRCHDGPPAARVTRIDTAPDASPAETGFVQRATF